MRVGSPGGIDAVLASAPQRVRELPVRRALWRSLLLDVAELALLYAVLPALAKAGQADPSTALSAGATASVFASLSTLDGIVVRVVGKALLDRLDLRRDRRPAGALPG